MSMPGADAPPHLPRLAQGGDCVPLVAHVVFQLGTGGLENGLVNLINRLPRKRYRHVVICVSTSGNFQERLERDDVEVVGLRKRPGLDPLVYGRAWRVFRDLRPDICHTRNLAALEMQVPAFLAGVPVRIHSEHGRDGKDINGDYERYNRIRRLLRPLVHHYLGVSRNLQRWMVETLRIPGGRVTQVYNGVDIVRFSPRAQVERPLIGPTGWLSPQDFLIGAVGRMVPIKDHLTLIRAFAAVRRMANDSPRRVRLVIVGAGAMMGQCVTEARAAGVEDDCWFPGDRSDIPEILQALDIFCLTSLNEGINNTVLEAMACGLPVVATRVGGNPELVLDEVTGSLVPPQSPDILATVLFGYLRDPHLCGQRGRRGRQHVEEHFSLERMVDEYGHLYDVALRSRGARLAVSPSNQQV